MIVGTSAAALTGLMFVVITLIADSKQPRTKDEIDTYATPVVVHFSAVVLIAAILGAPWPDGRAAGYGIGLTAVAGMVYMAVVLRRLLRPKPYRPVLEDWTWHFVLPFLGYIVLLVAHMSLRHDAHWAPYGIAAVAVLLLFVSIRNAWDIVTYMVVSKGKDS